mgnify:CR=1 FL=1
MDYQQIISDIKNKKYAPIYFLAGEEPYFIDKISDYVEHNVLEDHERDFNQTIFYGKDSAPSQIIETCKRFPMMSEKQVVIIKEAQHLATKLEEFEDYINQPQPSTILVFCHKYKKLDKRKSIGKLITKKTTFFASDKIKDYLLPKQIESQVKSNGLVINQKNSLLLSEYLGNNLGKIEMEIEKLKGILPPGGEINSTAIEEHIGISKEYNVFELQKAIATKNHTVAYKIANHFGKNEKANPFVLTIGFLFSYFSKVAVLQFSNNKNNDNVLAKEAGISPYFLKDYKVATSHSSNVQLVKIVGYLKEYDLKSKGVNNTTTSHNDLLKELLFKILN